MERTFSGYCRTIDGARIVLCEIDASEAEIGCDYTCCCYREQCCIGQMITELLVQTDRYL